MPNPTPTIGGNNYNLEQNPSPNGGQFVPNNGYNNDYNNSFNNSQNNPFDAGMNSNNPSFQTPNQFSNSTANQFSNQNNPNPQFQDYNATNTPNVVPNYNETYNKNPSQNSFETTNLPPNNFAPQANYQDPQVIPNNYQTLPPDYNSQINSQIPPQDPNAQVAIDSKTTFQERNSGNKLFFIIAGVVILGLLAAAGWLAYYSFGQNANLNPLNTGNSLQTNNSLANSNSISNSQNNSQNSQTSVSSSNSLSNSNFGINFSAPTSANNSAFSSSLGNFSNNFSNGFSQNGQNSSNSQVNSQPNSQQNTTQNQGGNQNGTPAQKARKNSEMTIPGIWLTQKFGSSYISNAVCQNLAVCGDGADPDNDGLNNLQEYNYGTDPINTDTDGDGVADGDEINVYSTDPSKKDSDSDGYEDNLELATCYDPTIQANAKTTATRLSEITKNVQLNPLHQPTISILQRAGATATDIQNGFIQSICSNSPSTNTNTNPNTNINTNTDLDSPNNSTSTPTTNPNVSF